MFLTISKNCQANVSTSATFDLPAESLRSFLDKSGKWKRRFLPVPDLSRKIEGDSSQGTFDPAFEGTVL